jgi:hypothetical protein
VKARPALYAELRPGDIANFEQSRDVAFADGDDAVGEHGASGVESPMDLCLGMSGKA